MYEVDRSTKSFRRSVRIAAKRGYDMSKLEAIDLLASGNTMPPNYLDHALRISFNGKHRENHADTASNKLKSRETAYCSSIGLPDKN